MFSAVYLKKDKTLLFKSFKSVIYICVIPAALLFVKFSALTAFRKRFILQAVIMANFRSVGAFLTGGNSNKGIQNVRNDADIDKQGILTKRKNMKNRYFVLRRETCSDQPARLEYYDSKKKFDEGANPKKKYILKDCFSISRKPDVKNNFTFALYINKDCVALLAQNEAEMEEWLQALQHCKSGSDSASGARKNDCHEHVWQVEVQPRSFASSQNLDGHQLACLKDRLFSLVRIDNTVIRQEFNLRTIRRCGRVDQFFFVELGRFSPIGSGTIWMKTEDQYIAQNMHNMVGDAMNNRSSSEGSGIRERTQSVSDTQRAVPPGPPRLRSDSVPACAKGQLIASEASLHNKSPGNTSRCGNFARPQSIPGSTESVESSSEEEPSARLPTPDLEFDDAYLQMNENTNPVLSPRYKTSSIKPSMDYEDNSEYVPMDALECRDTFQPPGSLLGLLPCVSHHISGTSTGSTCTPQGTSAPVSPSFGKNLLCWGSYFKNQLPSPQGSTESHSAAHSRSSSLIDDACDGYISMNMNPVSSFSSLSPVPPTQPSAASPGPYLEMGPGPASERRRAISTPTPIPISRCDGELYHEMSPNSGSSSLTSGTPSSDQRIHELISDRIPSGLGPSFSGGEEMDSLEPRPIRTSSVGSKPEQFKRKNRLDAIAIGEPARVRAFSVGSRVSLKFGVGRLGAAGGAQGSELPASGLGELFPSIKESGKQAKSKSSSAPMLGASPVSHSWSGPTGSYFRGFTQNRNQHRESNLMELDFSKNKSCDYIPDEKDKDRKASKDRLWHTVTGYRQRSSSKSSGGSYAKFMGGESSREKRFSEGDTGEKGIEIPLWSGDSKRDYFEMDFNPSPRSVNSDSLKGYLPMHPPSTAFISAFMNGSGSVNKRGPRQSSLSETYQEMSSSLSSCASQDGYVDMSQGSFSGMTVSSSSTSTSSVSSAASKTQRPLSTATTSPAQELHSPLEDFMDMDLIAEGDGNGGSELPSKKGKKGSKRKSFKESAKRKKSDVGSVGKSAELESPELPHKSKASGALSTLTSLIIRKPSTTKSPLSPQDSPFPKSAKESSSPFSSLKRTKSREARETNQVQEVSEDVVDTGATSPILDSYRRMVSLSSDLSVSPPSSEVNQFTTPSSVCKAEEKMLFIPAETHKLLRQTSKNGNDRGTGEKRGSAYMNLDLSSEATSGSLPSLNRLQFASKPFSLLDPRNYVNMQPGTSSPQLSPPAKKEKTSIEDDISTTIPTSITSAVQEEESSYMIMDGSSAKIYPPAVTPSAPIVACRPDIPSKLLSSHPQPPSLALEKLVISDHNSGAVNISERSRSHSGPGAPVGAIMDKNSPHKKLGDNGRAASACSSPISYSPPISPTLGSVSSMSSLSEGGLSSASSTCTVVNVGIQRQGQNNQPSKAFVTQEQTIAPAEPKDPQGFKAASKDIKNNTFATSASSNQPEAEAPNCVYVNLVQDSTNKTTASHKLPPKNGDESPSIKEEIPCKSVDSDFTKNEELMGESDDKNHSIH